MIEKNGTVTESAQGVESVDLAKVQEWMKRDISFAISLLNAIYSDPDLMESVAHFMLGRLNNSKNKPTQ